MSVNPASLFRIRYRMARGDYVALAVALGRLTPGHIAVGLVAYVALVMIIGLAFAGSLERLLVGLGAVLTFPDALVYIPLLVAGPVILALTPQISGLIAALTYRRYAMAEREVVLDLTAEGIEGGALDLYSRIGWAAVKRLIETPTHLFIQISPREALVVPRRAIDNEDAYRNIVGFIRARTGLSTR